VIPQDDFQVVEGTVYHARYRPKKHAFSYKVFNFLMDLDAVDEIASRHRWFSHTAFNLFSFRDRDHGVGDSDNLADYLRDALSAHGLVGADKIYALFYPRILGYAFNPIIVFYCYDKSGDLIATFYQVNSTFGERHTYLIPASPGANSVVQGAKKTLHVSPFVDMDMQYKIFVQAHGETVELVIDVNDREGLLLKTSFNGEAKAPASGLFGLFLRYPLMMVKVIGAIHWEAIRLIAKGMRLLPSGPRPKKPISMGSVIRLDP